MIRLKGREGPDKAQYIPSRILSHAKEAMKEVIGEASGGGPPLVYTPDL